MKTKLRLKDQINASLITFHLLFALFSSGCSNRATHAPSLGSGVDSAARDAFGGLDLAGGEVITSDDGSASNPMGYSIQFGRDSKLNDSGANLCTGTLIDSQVVLTAAHCKIKKGDIAVSRANGAAIEYRVREVSNHEAYSGNDTSASTVLNGSVDFSLVLLDRSTQGRPVPLADKSPMPGDVGTVAGYGYTLSKNAEDKEWLGASVDYKLRQGKMKVQKLLPAEDKERSGSASFYAEKVTGMTCTGDSGGAFIVNGQLVGVLSYGHKHNDKGNYTGACDEKFNDPDTYSAFASVSHQNDLIKKKMSDLLARKNSDGFPEDLEKYGIDMPTGCSLHSKDIAKESKSGRTYIVYGTVNCCSGLKGCCYNTDIGTLTSPPYRIAMSEVKVSSGGAIGKVVPMTCEGATRAADARMCESTQHVLQIYDTKPKVYGYYSRVSWGVTPFLIYCAGGVAPKIKK